MIVSTSTGDNESSSMPGVARNAFPLTICVQPVAINAAAHQTTTGLAAMDIASSPSRIEISPFEYCSTSECFRCGYGYRIVAGDVAA
jgi:hypothetical protein